MGVTANDRRMPRAAVRQTVAKQSLHESEKQLIHALLQDPQAGRSIEPFLGSGILAGAWSYPVIAGLIQNPDRNIEHVLGSLEDEQLRQEVRAALFEPFARVTADEALSSIAQLYETQLVRREKEIREQFKQYGSEGVPPELAKQLMDVAMEKSRIKSIKP